MVDPLFGTVGVPQLTGMPSPGFGWSQSPFLFANRQLGMGAEGMAFPPPSSQASTPFGVGPAPGFGVGPAPGGPFPVSPWPWSYGAPPNAYAAPGVDIAAALLSAVALRRGRPQGPTNDREVEDFVYDAFELLPGTDDVEIKCERGRVTVTGSVLQKRLKRDVGEICWTIPVVNDVQNNVNIATRRRARSGGSQEQPQGSGG